MTLERTLEDWAVKRLREVGANPIKFGQAGLPDRMVLWGGSTHFWIEFKKAKTGRLRVAQKVWKKYLTRIGDLVMVIDQREEVEATIAVMEMIYGPATARRIA